MVDKEERTIALAETSNERVREALVNLGEALKELDWENVQAATQVQTARAIAQLVNNLADWPNPEEFTDEVILSPKGIAMLLMGSIIPAAEAEPGNFNMHLKKVWLEVAEEIGPDWAEGLATAAAFMKKVMNFK